MKGQNMKISERERERERELIVSKTWGINKRVYYTVPSLALAGLLAIPALMIAGLPVTSGASATQSGSALNSTTTTSSDSVISVTAPSAVTLDVTPNFDESVFASVDFDVSVTTNNSWGYTLYAGTSGMDADGNATAALVHTETPTATIPTLSNDTTLSTFSSTSDTTTLNKWGFTTDNNGDDTSTGQITAGTYKAMTTTENNTLLKVTDEAISGDVTAVTFAVKADGSLIAGDYENTVVFSAVTNPDPDTRTLSDITTMQEVTPRICENSETSTADSIKEYTLTDTRDGTSYTIRKYADGNCWMSENLTLSAESVTAAGNSTTLTPSDSDVTSSTNFTLPAATSVGTTWTYDDNTARIITGASGINTVNSNGNTRDWQEGDGNYYTWGAATAGTAADTTDSGAEAAASICPKGWQLPSGSSQTTNKSFAKLAAKYSVTNDSAGSEILRADPLAFTYSGNYNYSSGTVSNVGAAGLYWSSTSYSTEMARLLRFRDTWADPQHTHYRGYGFTIRCVAQ